MGKLGVPYVRACARMARHSFQKDLVIRRRVLIIHDGV